MSVKMTFPEGKDIFSFEIQTGDFTHTSPKFKIAVQNLYVFAWQQIYSTSKAQIE